MAEIIQQPQLRYTADNQTAITEMVVQFDSIRPDEPPATLKTIAWGNRAEDIHTQYKVGDRVLLEGRLSMILVDRPEGFKEKRAELTISRVHPLVGGPAIAPPSPGNQPAIADPVAANQNVVSFESRRQPGTDMSDIASATLRERTPEFTPTPVTQPSAGVPISSGTANNYPPDSPSSVPAMPQTFDSESEKDLDEIPF